MLVYLPGRPDAPRTLAWVYRDGREEPIAAEPRAYIMARISPDGTKAILVMNDEDRDLGPERVGEHVNSSPTDVLAMPNMLPWHADRIAASLSDNGAVATGPSKLMMSHGRPRPLVPPSSRREVPLFVLILIRGNL